MARIKKFAPEQNLSSFQTFIVDDNPNSEYFRITEFKDTFTGGKNGFLIEGSQYLKESTEIKIEILDVEGNPVYYEPGNGIPEYYEGISKLIAVYVYNDTPIGLGKITILGELKQYDDNGVIRQVPAEWQGAYNVKWERTFQINKLLSNEDRVRFYRRPKVTIDEVVKPIFSGNPPTVTQTGSIDGIPLVPGENISLSNFSLPTSYRLVVASGSKWTGSVEGQVVTFDNINYSPTINEVVNETEIVVSPPYTVNGLVKSFIDEDYSVTFPYIEGVGDLATALTGSFAKINITDMKTFVGDAARVKVFRRSQSNLTDYEFVQEIQLESNELLRDITTFAKKEENYGIFTSDVLSSYWVTSSNDFNVTLNQDFLYNSAKLDSSPNNYFFTSQSFSIQSGVEYTLDLNVRKSINKSGDYLKVFLSGSTNGSSVSQPITTIDSSNTILQKTNFNENIVADSIQTASLYFEVSGSDWYINNVSLKASQETSFSPDEITFIQQVPKTLVSETFDYRFEFYDINNNYIPVRVETTKTFVGGNTNLFEKSIEITPDNLYFSFDSASNPANPIPPTVINFDVQTTLVTGSITYTSGAYDFKGNLIPEASYSAGQYPGYLTDWDVDLGRQPFLRVQDFTGSRDDITVQFIRFTGAVEGISDTFVITRVEDGKGGVSFEIVPFRGLQIKNKESKTLEVQAVRVDGINRIQLRDGLSRGWSEAKLHVLSSSLDGTQTYVSLSQAITNPNFLEGVSAGLTGSGEIDYNAIFTRDAIDNELTLYLMDGPTSSSILTSVILTDLKDGLNNGVVTSTTDQFNIKYEPRKLSPFAPQQSIVTASFQRRGTTLNPLSASLIIYPSSSIEPKTELPHFYMFYETGAFDDTITLLATDYLGNVIDSGIPGVTAGVAYYSAVETKQLNLEFTYTEPITSASVTANKSFFITPDGLPGQNAIIIDIDPQPVALGSNHKGEVYNYGLANTDIQITQGDLFLINTASGDPGTFTTRSITTTNIQFTSLDGNSSTTMSLSGFESMSALSASIRYDFDIYPYFTASLVTASRTQKFTKVVEGAGAIEVTLDPIAVAFNADESGFISNYSLASTEVFIKQNDEFLIYDPTNAGTPGTFLTASISASGITFNEISSSQRDLSFSGDEILHFKGFSGIERNQPSASITYNFRVYPYSLDGGVAGVPRIVSKTQTFSKVNDGSKARKVSLQTSAATVVYDGDGIKVAPSGDVVLTATSFNTTGSAYYKFLNSDGSTLQVSSTTDNVILPSLPGAGTGSTFSVELRDGSPNGLVFDTDSVTVSGVQEGSTAYSVVLSNAASSVTVEVDGTKYFDNTGTLIRAYKGGTELQFVEEYDEEAVDPITFLPIGTFGQFSASIYEISSFLTAGTLRDGKYIVSKSISPTEDELYGSASAVSNWNNPQDNTQGFITYKIDFENGRGTQFVQQSFSTVFEGATGPGVVFRGPWTGSIEYIYNKDSKRRDAVLWSENGSEPYDTYYATKDSGSSYLVPSGSSYAPTVGGVLNDLYWESLGQEEFFVAAKIAIFEESFVKNTINVGQPATSYAVNPQITIYGGDSEPYISIGQGTQGYGFQGIYLGVTEDGGPNRTSGTSGLLSIEDDTGQSYLRWDGYNLEVKSDSVLIETPNMTIDSQNELISIGQGTQGFTSGGVFLGQDGADSKLSLVGTPDVGGNYNALEWDGSTLTIRGAIRQTAAGQIEPSLRGVWADATQYYTNDSVVYNGQSWSATSNHTSNVSGGVTTGPPGTGPWIASSGTGKTVSLSADTFVITYDANGENPSPSTINLFASSSNFVDPYFKFTGGGSNFTDETSFTDGADGNNDSVTSISVPTNISGMPLQFRVGVADGGLSGQDQVELISDVINIFGIEPGADSTPMYFITPIAGGTQLKNSGGTIELQVQKSDSTGLSDVTTGWPKIYDGATLLAVQTGVTAGTNGVEYNPIIAPSFINGTKTLSLKNSGGNVLDTITLVDVTDGLGGGSFISPNLKSTRNPVTNNYLPGYLSLTASFFDVTGSEHTKAIKITPNYDSGTDYMYYDNDAGAHTDSEITLTIDDGDGTVFSGTGIGNKLPTKDVVVTAEFTDTISGQTSTIVETVYIISDGADGLDAISVALSNSSHTLAAASDGTVTSYAGSGTTISVYEGINQLNHDGVGTSNGTFKVVAVPINITVGSITDDGDDALVGNHSSMTDVSASIQYQITGSRVSGSSFTAQTIQTLTKAVAGTAGVNAKTIRLSADNQAFVESNTGAVNPNYIAFTVNKQNITANTTWATSPSVNLYTDATGGSTSVTGDDTVFLRKADFGSNTAVTVTATADSLSDEITIVKVTEGSNAITLVSSNQSHTFQADSGGTISSYAGGGTKIEIYEGATKLNYDGGIPPSDGEWSIGNIVDTDITVDGSPTIGADYIQYNTHSNMSANQASIRYGITGSRQNGTEFRIDTIQSFSKSVAGAAGSSGTSGTSGADGAAGTPSGIVYAGSWTADGTYSNPNVYLAETELKYVVKYSSGANNYWVCATTHRIRGTFDTGNDYEIDDVVKYNDGGGEDWYICIQAAPALSVDPSNSSYFTNIGTVAGNAIRPGTWGAGWEAFGAEFTSVATDILFAQDVYADRTVNIGSKGGSPVISLNADAAGTNANPYISIGQGGTQGYAQDGIFMGFDSATPKFSIYGDITNPETGFVQFDGTDFTFSGLVTGSAVQGGELLIGFDTTSGEWNFRVNGSGEVTAQGDNNVFSGTITANNGVLGGWNINSSGIYDDAGSIVLSSEDKEISVSDSGGQQRFNANTGTVLPTVGGGSLVQVSLSGLGSISETLGKGNTTTGTSQAATDYLLSPAMNVTIAGKYKLRTPHVQNSSAFAEAVGAGSWATITVKVELRKGTGADSTTGTRGTLVGSTTSITATSTGYDIGGIGGALSVAKGTQISLPNNQTKNVEDLRIGDSIIAWNVQTNQYEAAKLKKVKSRVVDTIYRVKAGGNVVDVSDSHGFFYAPGWEIKVQNLRAGEDEIYVKEGNTFVKRVVDSIEILDKEIEVYSLSVPPLKNYISNNIVSHNYATSYPESGGKNLLPSTTFTKTFDNLAAVNHWAHYVVDYTLNVFAADNDYWAEIGYAIFTAGSAYATLEPQTTGTFVNGGGFAVVNDDNDYFRVASNDEKQYGYAVGYATDLKGGLAIDKLYGAGGNTPIGDVGGAYNVAGHPYTIKGAGIVTFTSGATGTHSSGTIQMSAGNFDSIGGTIQGLYIVNYISTLATGSPPQNKYATIIASGRRAQGGTDATTYIGNVAPMGVTTAITNNTTGAGSATVYVGKPNASILENLQNLQFIIIQ